MSSVKIAGFAFVALVSLSASAGWKVVPPPHRDTVFLTEWGEKVTPENAWREYPRPQMVRSNWTNLNGVWQFAECHETNGIPTSYTEEILVPYPVGSQLSGITRQIPHTNAVWYGRTFAAHPRAGERTLLHIDGSDFRTQVFVNGVEATDVPHETAQLALTVDITAFLRDGENRLDVQAWDPMGGNALSGYSHGKQSKVFNPCFYTPITGIWAPVWLETVPERHIRGYRVTPDFAKSTVRFEFDVTGGGKVEVRVEGTATTPVRADADGRVVELKLADVKAWSPENPHLYPFTAKYGTDEVKGYFAMRTLEMKKDVQGVLRLYLNGKPYFLLGTLDQGWWPDGLLTPPSDAAMEYDIKALKSLGFNMMRKHIKVEPMRYYHLCDKLGILVLQDMPSGGGDLNGRYGRYRAELKGMIDQLYNVPSVVMWIPYNERWGQPKAPQTSWTLTWTKRYDPSRLVDGPSGWSDYEGGYWKSLDGKGTLTKTEHLPEGVPESADLIDFHAYPGPVMLPVNSHRASFIGEFGGLGVKLAGHVWNENYKKNWGYGGTGGTDVAPVEKKYYELMEKLASLAGQGLCGSVYTQTTDVEHEINGLLTYDRKAVKFDAAKVRAAHERVLRAAEYAATHRIERIAVCVKEDPDPKAWAYRTDAAAPDGWERPDFDDAQWKRTAGGLGSAEMTKTHPGTKVSAIWNTKVLRVRRHFAWNRTGEIVDVLADLFHDESVKLYLNGRLVFSCDGHNHGYDPFAIDAAAFAAALKTGDNVLAAEVTQTYGGQYFDMGLRVGLANP